MRRCLGAVIVVISVKTQVVAGDSPGLVQADDLAGIVARPMGHDIVDHVFVEQAVDLAFRQIAALGRFDSQAIGLVANRSGFLHQNQVATRLCGENARFGDAVLLRDLEPCFEHFDDGVLVLRVVLFYLNICCRWCFGGRSWSRSPRRRSLGPTPTLAPLGLGLAGRRTTTTTTTATAATTAATTRPPSR